MASASGVDGVNSPRPAEQDPADDADDGEHDDEQELAERDQEGNSDEYQEQDERDDDQDDDYAPGDVRGAARVGYVAEVGGSSAHPP